MNRNQTLQQMFDKALAVQKESPDEVFINLDFEAPSDEVAQVLRLSLSVVILYSAFEFPDTGEYDFVPDFIWFSKKMLDSVSDKEADPVKLAFRTTERELSAADDILSNGMKIFGREKYLSDNTANIAIAIESFRQRLLKTAEVRN